MIARSVNEVLLHAEILFVGLDRFVRNKVYHPFGDFLLHDIGTGEGIVETNGELTRNKMRTAPLWGLRTRDKFMHDGGMRCKDYYQAHNCFEYLLLSSDPE